jgi:hypothetical protein
LEINAADPLDEVQAELAAAWGPRNEVRQVDWRVFLRVGRLD